jgi:hypothetical protein
VLSMCQINAVMFIYLIYNYLYIYDLTIIRDNLEYLHMLPPSMIYTVVKISGIFQCSLYISYKTVAVKTYTEVNLYLILIYHINLQM